MSTTEKYRDKAERWSDEQYADPGRYLRRRADLVVSLGPPLEPGDRVLDLACGDGGAAEPLLDRGLEYLGVDGSEAMVAAARRRLNRLSGSEPLSSGRARVELGDLNDFRPREAVAATTCFRAIYYTRDREAFFRRVAEYTEKKLVFDLNPRQYAPPVVCAELRAAGFGQIFLRPFFVPQRVALPGPAAALLEAAEQGGPLARLALRVRFSYVCAASRG